jgi:hypothetical protein
LANHRGTKVPNKDNYFDFLATHFAFLKENIGILEEDKINPKVYYQ